MKRVVLIFLLSCIVSLISLTEARGNGPDDKKKKIGETELTIDLAVERPKGNKMRGPAMITFKNVNVLRYDVEIGTDVKFTDGPKLDLPFIPKVGGDTAKLESKNDTKSAFAALQENQTLDQRLQAIDSLLTKLEQNAKAARGKIASAVDAVNNASTETSTLVLTSDAILKASGPKPILEQINTIELDIKSALTNPENKWPNEDVSTLLSEVNEVKRNLEAFPTLDGFYNWYSTHHGGYDEAKRHAENLLTAANAMSSDSSEGKKFLETKNNLAKWYDIIQGVKAGGVSAFTRTFHVGCGFAFDQNKETAVKVVMRDRISSATATDSKDSSSKPAAADTKQGEIEIVTVICSSPFSISGGFGFSTIEEKEFVFVQSLPDAGSTAKTVNRFGFKNQSSFRVIPLILLNTRLWEWSDLFALHASGGIGVDVKTGQAGTDIEYFVGPSLSFRRSFFITPALHIGRVPSLVGGFKLGDVVPDGVSSPPVEKTWKRAFALTFTYKIK